MVHMTVLQYVWLYAISVPVFFAIDMVWLGYVARSLYQSQIGHLLGEVNWPVAIAFYLLFLVGLLCIAIVPGFSGRGIMYAVMWGAFFGFFTYATYDLTNWATLRDWPAFIVLIDIVWGTVLSASVAGITVWLAGMFLK